MADEEMTGIEISEVLGTITSENDPRVFIGVRDASGQELVLALSSDDSLRKLLLAAFDGRGMFPISKGLGKGTVGLVSADWFTAGLVRDPGSTDLFVTFYRESNGHLSFRIDREMAGRLVEALQAALGRSTSPQPGTTN